MMWESIITLGLMAILLIGSPGPAAMALAATGSSHSFRQGLPLILGLITGVLLTGLLTSAGMLTLFSRWPEARVVMQIIGGVFILVMALRMLRQPMEGEKGSVEQGEAGQGKAAQGDVAQGLTQEAGTQFGFRSGVLMNILSPKAYAVFMLLISQFMPPMSSQLSSVLLLESVAFVATVIVTFSWLLFGLLLGRLIRTPAGKQKMRAIFAGLMIVFVMPMLFSIPG